MKIVDWDRLPPKYDSLLYINIATGEISLECEKGMKLYKAYSVLLKIFLINLLTHKEVYCIYRDKKRQHWLKVYLRNGDMYEILTERTCLKRKYPELYKIEKEITKTIIEVK